MDAILAKDGTLFTDSRVGGQVGLLDWYTLAVAIFFMVLLTAHGATYLTMRTTGAVHDRARAIARRLWIVVFLALALIAYLTWIMRPGLLQAMPGRPFVWAAFAICIAGACSLGIGIKWRQERLTVGGSTALIFGIIMTGAAALFPVMMFSILNPADQLTAAACAAPEHSLWVATVWWFPALALAIGYAAAIQRHYSGKVDVEKDTQGMY